MNNGNIISKQWYQKLNYTKMFLCLFIIASVGHVLNMFWKHKHFYVNQYLLLIMLIIQIVILKKLDLENEIIEKNLKKKGEAAVWGSFNSKVTNGSSSLQNTIISLFFVFIYIFTMFKVGCLEYTPTGIYGGGLGAVVFFVGIQAYLKYLGLLYFAYDLKRINIEHYFFYIPALTDWIVQLAHEFSYIEKWFLTLGVMYSAIYAINIPDNAIIVNHGISIQTPSNTLFIITWIGIIIFFAFAVPAFTFLSRHFIKECVCKCKSLSINGLEKQILVLSNTASETDLNNIQTRLSLIKEISMSEDYPLRYHHTVFDNFYTIGMTLLTLASPFMSIIQQFIFKW